MSAPSLAPAKRLCDFINRSPSPFHAVARSCELLRAAGFECISERSAWSETLKPGGSYFFTRYVWRRGEEKKKNKNEN
jgi:aspartyl aminopeptidase